MTRSVSSQNSFVRSLTIGFVAGIGRHANGATLVLFDFIRFSVAPKQAFIDFNLVVEADLHHLSMGTHCGPVAVVGERLVSGSQSWFGNPHQYGPCYDLDAAVADSVDAQTRSRLVPES